MCRLDGPLNMAVSTRSMSGAEPDDYQATLPKSVIALAFDRAINPIHPASSALFLNIKAILEQEQQAEKKRKEELQEMASNKRAKATVDTATANPDDQPKSGPEMPPPPVPSKKAQNPERRRSDSKREVRYWLDMRKSKLTPPAGGWHGLHPRHTDAGSEADGCPQG